jgi:excisionase family DNA binding protein
MNPSSEPRFFNAQEASRYLGMPLATLYGYTHRRQIPHYKRGRILMFDRADLDQWMSELKVPVAESRAALPLEH